MNGSVLIADDEPLARRTLREHLRSLGWSGEIHEARDGKTAVAVANSERPDLVFLDIVMPGATGIIRPWADCLESASRFGVAAASSGGVLNPTRQNQSAKLHRRVIGLLLDFLNCGK